MIITITDHERLLSSLPSLLYPDEASTLRSAAVRVEFNPCGVDPSRVATWALNQAMMVRAEVPTSVLFRAPGASPSTSAIIPWHLLCAGYTRFEVTETTLRATGREAMGAITYDWRGAMQPTQGFDATMPGGTPAFACVVERKELVAQVKACVKETRASYAVAKDVPDSSLVIVRASSSGSPYLHLSSVLRSERPHLDLAIDRGTRNVRAASDAFVRDADVRGVRATVDAKKLLRLLDAWTEFFVRVEIRRGEHTPLVLRSVFSGSFLAAQLAPMLS